VSQVHPTNGLVGFTHPESATKDTNPATEKAVVVVRPISKRRNEI